MLENRKVSFGDTFLIGGFYGNKKIWRYKHKERNSKRENKTNKRRKENKKRRKKNKEKRK